MKAYADGACSGNPGPGGWAVLLQHPDGYIEEHGGREEISTNNRMELTAVIRAMELVWKALGEEEVVKAARPQVFTDSKYVVHGVNAWLAAWRRRGFCKSNGEEIANRDLWEQLCELGPEYFQFVWLRGHNGDEAQERVDQLACDLSKGKEVIFSRGYIHSQPIPGLQYPLYVTLLDGKVNRYQTWEQCSKAVLGKSGAVYRKVKSRYEERQLLQTWGCNGA